MPTNRSSKRLLRKKKKSKEPDIVGPDYVQVLKGNLCGKKVALVLCGESHFDAVDVTRSGGRFHAKYGWIEDSKFKEMKKEKCGLVLDCSKPQSLEQAKTFAKDWVEEHEDHDQWSHSFGCKLWLLWVPLQSGGRSNKGKYYLLEVNESRSSDSDEESSAELPPLVQNLMEQPASEFRVFEWGDIDDQARNLNRSRMSDHEICIEAHDTVIKERVRQRRKQDIWTWDDWFSHVQQRNTNMQLLLEATIPPWEVELHQPQNDETASVKRAHDLIRCVSSDSEASSVDEFDPSSDGIGSYMDYCYRKFAKQMLEEQLKHSDQSSSVSQTRSTWLHCVDSRDLGDAAACHYDGIKKLWNDLLITEKRLGMQNNEDYASSSDETNGSVEQFQRASMFNPELKELQTLKERGLLKETMVQERGAVDDDHLDTSFPSFEGFFGQCTDCLYYTPHVKMRYSPFLARCVGSLKTWQDFMTCLFFGGTIPDALAMLKSDCEEFSHVRSPLQVKWHESTKEYTFKKRDDHDQYISYLHFPKHIYLKSNGSLPPRTVSSHLFETLSTSDPSVREVATKAREWSLSCAYRHSNDPKNADDGDCGGEWFVAYLRAAHRDIYEDVDNSDPSALLKRNYIASTSEGRRKKYNIGKIMIPDAKEAFTLMLEALKEAESHKTLLPMHEKKVSARVEVLAQIAIDVWMSNLVDFFSVLKIAQVVQQSPESNVVVVCYMGSAHTRSIASFYEELNFRRASFVGQYCWDEAEEVKTLELPPALWNLDLLFRKT